MKIYTKAGDDGSTGLLYGGRVNKDDLRTEAYGTTDEAVSMLGMAHAFEPAAPGLADLILRLQRELFVVGAELATDPKNADKLKPGTTKVTQQMVDALESDIDALTAVAPLPDRFIVPGSTKVSAALDAARAVVRRAERRVVTMNAQGALGDEVVLRYLNRLSDLLFTMARAEEHHLNITPPAAF